MPFTVNDIIFTSEKAYENLKELDDLILSLLYTKINKLKYSYLLNCSIMRIGEKKI